MTQLVALSVNRGGEASQCSLVQISKDPATGPARESSNGGSNGSRRGLVAAAGPGLSPQGRGGQVCVTALPHSQLLSWAEAVYGGACGQGGADSYLFPWIYLGAGRQHQGGKGPSLPDLSHKDLPPACSCCSQLAREAG